MNDEINKIDKTLIELEREEINLLINKGIAFSVTLKVKQPVKGIRGLFNKKETVEKRYDFEIRQPTLATLDRICDISLDMIIDDDYFKNSNNVLNKARGLVKDNVRRLARMLAIAVLGEDCYITEITELGKIKQYTDDKEITRLTDLFLHTVTPSKLLYLATTITNISNLADFTASMRLLSGARTTEPIKNRIE
ncbi:MAG: hypothetical protein LBJ63_07835 [Prevotellaceae bacterium]|jgi:hypothetical protein|nr:hypothetical protein [Prevotellaceae bacterium]